MKDRASPLVVTVKVVPERTFGNPSHVRRNLATSLRISWELLVGMEMTMLRATVLATLTGVLVADKLGLGEDVPPGADLVEVGVRVLLELGRLELVSLG